MDYEADKALAQSTTAFIISLDTDETPLPPSPLPNTSTKLFPEGHINASGSENESVTVSNCQPESSSSKWYPHQYQSHSKSEHQASSGDAPSFMNGNTVAHSATINITSTTRASLPLYPPAYVQQQRDDMEGPSPHPGAVVVESTTTSLPQQVQTETYAIETEMIHHQGPLAPAVPIAVATTSRAPMPTPIYRRPFLEEDELPGYIPIPISALPFNLPEDQSTTYVVIPSYSLVESLDYEVRRQHIPSNIVGHTHPATTHTLTLTQTQTQTGPCGPGQPTHLQQRQDETLQIEEAEEEEREEVREGSPSQQGAWTLEYWVEDTIEYLCYLMDPKLSGKSTQLVPRTRNSRRFIRNHNLQGSLRTLLSQRSAAQSDPNALTELPMTVRDLQPQNPSQIRNSHQLLQNEHDSGRSYEVVAERDRQPGQEAIEFNHMDASQHRSLSDTNINNDRVQRSSGLERVATGHIRGGPPPLNRPGGPASRSRRYVPPRRRGPVRQSEGMTPADQRSPGAATTALLANTQTHASSVSSHDLENTDTLSLPVLRTMAPVSGEGNIRDMSPLSAPRPHSPSTEVPVAAPVTVSVISGPLPSASLTFFGATAMVEIADVTEEVLASADTSQASAGSELQVNPSSLATPILTSTVVVPTPLPPPSSPTSSLLRTSINARPLPSVQHVQVNDGYEGEEEDTILAHQLSLGLDQANRNGSDNNLFNNALTSEFFKRPSFAFVSAEDPQTWIWWSIHHDTNLQQCRQESSHGEVVMWWRTRLDYYSKENKAKRLEQRRLKKLQQRQEQQQLLSAIQRGKRMSLIERLKSSLDLKPSYRESMEISMRIRGQHYAWREECGIHASISSSGSATISSTQPPLPPPPPFEQANSSAFGRFDGLNSITSQGQEHNRGQGNIFTPRIATTGINYTMPSVPETPARRLFTLARDDFLVMGQRVKGGPVAEVWIIPDNDRSEDPLLSDIQPAGQGRATSRSLGADPLSSGQSQSTAADAAMMTLRANTQQGYINLSPFSSSSSSTPNEHSESSPNDPRWSSSFPISLRKRRAVIRVLHGLRPEVETFALSTGPRLPELFNLYSEESIPGPSKASFACSLLTFGFVFLAIFVAIASSR